MQQGAVRPRFNLTLAGPVDRHIQRLCNEADRPEHRCVRRVLARHVDLTVIRADRHRWSPCIQLEFGPSGSDTIVHGLIGPHPNVWTLYAFINITLLLVAGFGLIVGLSQWSLGLHAWAMWTVPGAAVGLGAMYALAQLGQRLAANQTRRLVGVVEAGLDTTIG